MIKRTILQYVNIELSNYPVVVITGPRQVGKSTLAYSFVETRNFKYVSLDDINERQLATEDPKYFIEKNGYPLIIDEVQYAPRLIEVIESIVNTKRLEKKESNGLFLLTGSQTYRLMKNLTESLAGRAAIIKMMPLSENEVNQTKETPFVPSIDHISESSDKPVLKIDDLFQKITKGYYPELFNNPGMDSNRYYSYYVSTYIDRDVSELINVKDKLKFTQFMTVLASLTGQELVMDNLSKIIGVSIPTIKEWVSVLETSGIIYLLQPYNEASIIKRIVKRPKIYFSDTGLASHLAKLQNAKNLASSHFAGAFVETYVMNEIMKSYINNGYEFNAYYYRDNNANEIDLILVRDGILYCVEIKSGMTYSLIDVKAFKQIEKTKYSLGASGIICSTPKYYSLSSNVHVIPISSI